MSGIARLVQATLAAVVLVLPIGAAVLSSAADVVAPGCGADVTSTEGEPARAPTSQVPPSARVAAADDCVLDWSMQVRSDGALAAVYAGGRTGCVLPDPTGTGGCVAGSTRHLLEQVRVGWGPWPGSCWDAHAWNPRSDHPRGLACDFTVGRLGWRPSAQERVRGWALAEWLLAGADRLTVRYVIFDGLFCPAGGACRPYGGGGVYDPESVTGGHFDHVHVSLRDGSGVA